MELGETPQRAGGLIFSEGFSVCNVLFLRPRTHSWQLLFIALLFSWLLLCCQVLTQSLPESFGSFLSSSFFFFTPQREGKVGTFSQDTVLMPDFHPGGTHPGSELLRSAASGGCTNPCSVSCDPLGTWRRGTRLTAACRSSGYSSACSWG